MSCTSTSTRAIGSPSRLAVESCAACSAGPACVPSPAARAGGMARKATTSAPRASALARRAQSITGQLGLSGERIPFDEIVQRLLGLCRLLQLLLAQRQLVQRGRNPVPIGVLLSHQRVFGGGAVEPGLREEAFADSVLRVVGELVGREALDEVAESTERHRVPALGDVLDGLVVELVRIGPRGRRGGGGALGHLLEAPHHLVELALDAP